MIQILLTALIWILAPIPWIITAIHILIKNNGWRASRTKATVWIISIIVWAILALWLKSNYQILFEQEFSTSISIFPGIALLVIAAVIELVTEQALGIKRILGSSEFEKSQDKLITSGIYKYARHPRYFEHPLWFVGLGLTFGYTSMLWFALYLFISFAITAHFEEQELIKRYGKEYLNYKKKTPAFFIGGKN
jgi:protein-S-isoprenylcysteine O-methyltransferase Ste14